MAMIGGGDRSDAECELAGEAASARMETAKLRERVAELEGLQRRLHPPRPGPTPTEPAYYWAKWRIKAEGTADEDDAPTDHWEIVEVVVNCLDEDDDEHLGVFVHGVEKMQWLDCFFWGQRICSPPERS